MLNILGDKVPTMIMGADVTHPPAGSLGGVSIAAVVASMDSKLVIFILFIKITLMCSCFVYSFVDYRAAIKLQPPRMEIIGALGEITIELLQLFKDRNGGRFPERIIFYRDGVSEAQVIGSTLNIISS